MAGHGQSTADVERLAARAPREPYEPEPGGELRCDAARGREPVAHAVVLFVDAVAARAPRARAVRAWPASARAVSGATSTAMPPGTIAVQQVALAEGRARRRAASAP